MSAFSWPEGLLTPLLTPFKDDEVDFAAFEALLARQLNAGVAGVVVGGGSGEHGALTIDERRQLAAAAVAGLAERVPVIVQAGTLATRDALTLARHAEEVGAAGLLVASPFGEPISWKERRRFYADVADATALPIMLYNTPPAGIMTLPEVQELAALPTVSAIKDSSGDLTLFGDLVSTADATGLAVYVGVDSLVPTAIGLGGRGALVGSANVVPEALLRVIALARAADAGQLAALWPALRSLLRFLEGSSNYVALCKAGLALRGLDVGGVRPPYQMPEDAETRTLRGLLAGVEKAFGRLGATMAP